MTFADAEYAGKSKQSRKELFLIEMDQKHWNEWMTRSLLIDLLSSKSAEAEAGRKYRATSDRS